MRNISFGIAFITSLLIFSIFSNTINLHSDSMPVSQFQDIKIYNLLKNPGDYEGKEISFQEQIKSVISLNSSRYILETANGLELHTFSHDTLEEGLIVFFRGKSFLISMGFIEIVDFHIINNESIYWIYSIIGGIIFILLFFSVFKFDWKLLSFISSMRKNA